MNKEMNFISLILEDMDKNYSRNVDYELFGYLLSEMHKDIIDSIKEEIMDYYDILMSTNNKEFPNDANDYYSSQYFYSLDILIGLSNYNNKEIPAKEYNIKILNEYEIPHLI